MKKGYCDLDSHQTVNVFHLFSEAIVTIKLLHS